MRHCARPLRSGGCVPPRPAARASFDFKPLALALALASLAAVQAPAQAQSSWIARCLGDFFEPGARPECHQPYSEGLAAVLTGSAGDAAGRWGYLDKQGRMAIAPAYDEAEPFQNGLAAVNKDGRWGYIDRGGRWAIEPRYARASGFNAEGSAVVEADGRDVLIDRQGKTLKTFALGARSWGFRPGQKLAAMEIPQPPRLFNVATGKAATLPEGVMRLAAPTGGYLPAQLRDTRYGGWWGLLDQAGGWAVTPQALQSQEPPLRDGALLAVRRDERWLFVDAAGQALSSERYRQLQSVAPGLWLARPDDGGPAQLLDGQRQVLHRFRSPYAGVQDREGWRFMVDDDLVLLVDAADRLIRVPVGQGRVDVREGQAWISGAQPGNAPQAQAAEQPGQDAVARAEDASAPVEAEAAEDIGGEPAADDAGAMIASDAAIPAAAPADAPPPPMIPMPPVSAASEAGAAADAADAADAAAAAAEAAAAAAASGAEISQGGLVQIYAADGRPLLDDATVARLRAYDVTAFSRRDESRRGAAGTAPMPLALLRPHAYGQPIGILTPAGKIVTNADWDDISAYDVSMPLPVRTREGKAGAIDAAGKWAVPPRFGNLRPFRGGYAWARPAGSQRGEEVLIDAQGKTVAVPDAVLDGAEGLDGDMLHYRAPDENRERRWGVWNLRAGAPVLKPVYDGIEAFRDGWALVQERGQWGVIDSKGRWALRPAYQSAYELEYLGNGLMLVPDTGPRASDSSRGYRLVNLRSGKSSPALANKPTALKDGRYIAELEDAGLMLFDADGAGLRLADSRQRRNEVYGDWIYMEGDEREGAIDARGELKVPALYGEFNPFFVQPEGLARAYDGAGYRLIDQNGKTLLDGRGDGTPLAGMQRIVYQDDGGSVMTDLRGNEVARVPGSYSVRYRFASEGVVPYSGDGGNDRYGFVDAAGKRIVGPHFDWLGPLRNGLAVAQRKQRTGKQFGYIDLSGRYAIPPLFSWAGDFHEERALVRQDGYTQFIDTKGEPLATFVMVCDTLTILDRLGRISWPQQKMSCPAAGKFELAPDNAKAEQQ